MFFAICLLIIGIFMISIIFFQLTCKRCKSKSSNYSISEDVVFPGITAIGLIVAGGFLIKESVRKQADKIIGKVEFCSKDYKVNCKITTINNKSDTVYFLTKKK